MTNTGKNLKFTFFAIAAILILLVVNVSAKDEWLQVKSKNFNLIGNASDKDIRKVGTKLEQFRETFRQLFSGTNLNATIPTNVIVFKSDGSYKQFKPKRADGKIDNFIAGYFQPGEDVNYITLSTEGDDADTYGTIFHEYVHFIINTNFGKSEVPPWFNEGLAEYYQTFEISEDQKVKLGLPQSNHLALLQQNKLIPLDTLFKISNYALHQNENHSRSIFYAESWALIHYFVQNGKAEGLNEFLKYALKDVPSEKAFQNAFQLNYIQMEKELRKYVAQNSYKYSLVSFKNKMVFENEMTTTPLPEAESNAYLGDLLYHTNRAEDAEPFLQKAIALKPDSSMANNTYGMVKLRQRKYDEAAVYFEKAISENQKNHLAYYNYAFLLSREGRDESGFVQSFPTDKSAKMHDLLKKAIAAKPSFTESYELFAFVALVNNENLDEALTLLQKALQFQPGNQRYSLRIAEIYERQNKLAEAKSIADKIAETSDDPQTKANAESIVSQIQRREQYNADNEAARKRYEAEAAEASKDGGRQILVRRKSAEKTLTPEEIAKRREEAEIYSVNQSLRKAENIETRVIGRIQKIECKGAAVTYTVKTDTETFALTSSGFENLALVALIADLKDAEVGCGANLATVNAVITYKPQTAGKNAVRGEMVAMDFVPNNFRFMDVSKNLNHSDDIYESEQSSSDTGGITNGGGIGEERDGAIRSALRHPQTGEKREIGLIEKVECGARGMFFIVKSSTQTYKLAATSPQSLQMRGFTPEVTQIQFGCNLKQVDIPVVFTYKVAADAKNKSDGELVSLEFVPKNFVLDQ